MDYYIKQLLNGLENGSIYALVALGYTMVYGIVKLINFAHGDFIMVGAYTTLFSIPFFVSCGFPGWLVLILTIIVAIISCSLLGVVTEKIAYKPLRNSKRITALITAIAVSLFLQNLFSLIFTPSQKRFQSQLMYTKKTVFEIFGAGVTNTFIMILSTAIIIMILLSVFVKKTKTGRAMRAVSENPDAAVLMGVNINKTISITFAIGAGLAGFASIMYCVRYGFFEPFIGSKMGLNAFIAAVVGGIGSIPGAVLGGYIIGLVEAISQTFLPTGLSDAIVFAILIIVLLVKPSGILGKKVGEKV